MGCLKAMDNTSGLMEVFIEVISSRVFGMAMVYGKTAKKYLKGCIAWIRRKALASINGRISKFIEENLDKTFETATVNSMQSVKINRKS